MSDPVELVLEVETVELVLDSASQGPAGPPGDDGADGTDGTDGTNGTDGADGEGVPTGGTAGQFLRKQSGTDFDTEWAAPGISEVTGLQLALNAKATEADLTTEEGARAAADTALDGRLDTLEAISFATDAELAAAVAAEAATRAAADTALDGRLDALEAGARSSARIFMLMGG